VLLGGRRHRLSPIVGRWLIFAVGSAFPVASLA
jgi:hypothetical protein